MLFDKSCVSTSTMPMTIKLPRVVNYLPNTSHNLLITWSHDSKNAIFPLPQFQLEIKNIEKLGNKKLFSIIQKISIFKFRYSSL